MSTTTTPTHYTEEQYIRSCYGLTVDLPTFEDRDGFRMQASWRDGEWMLQNGWKLVAKVSIK